MLSLYSNDDSMSHYTGGKTTEKEMPLISMILRIMPRFL